VSLLISNGANVNPDAAFRVPLQVQVELGDAESVKTLVEAGANIDASLWPNGATTLILAASTPSPAIVKVLLQRGAKVNAKDANGRTALDALPRYDRMIFVDDETERAWYSGEGDRMQRSADEVKRMLLAARAASGHQSN
jgi:ankyrin repeat protein